MSRFIALFVFLLAALFALELSIPVQTHLIQPWTTLLAKISAGILMPFSNGVHAYGNILEHKTSGIGVSIEPGCNGVEACIILIAAMLAYPTTWRKRSIGIAIGMVAVQALNILRIITLFYLVAWNRSVFDFAHLYLWQALIMLDVLVVWLLWIRNINRTRVSHEAAT